MTVWQVGYRNSTQGYVEMPAQEAGFIKGMYTLKIGYLCRREIDISVHLFVFSFDWQNRNTPNVNFYSINQTIRPIRGVCITSLTNQRSGNRYYCSLIGLFVWFHFCLIHFCSVHVNQTIRPIRGVCINISVHWLVFSCLIDRTEVFELMVRRVWIPFMAL